MMASGKVQLGRLDREVLKNEELSCLLQVFHRGHWGQRGSVYGGHVCTWCSITGPDIRPRGSQVELNSGPWRLLRVSSPSSSNYKLLSVLISVIPKS